VYFNNIQRAELLIDDGKSCFVYYFIHLVEYREIATPIVYLFLLVPIIQPSHLKLATVN